MQNLINYLKSHKRYILKTVLRYYLTQEVINTLKKYNFSINELCYRICNNIPFDKVFRCKLCGKVIPYVRHQGFKQFCNSVCSGNYNSNLPEVQERYRETCKRLYGVENYAQTEAYLIKSQQTNIIKYNKPSFSQTDEYKKRIQEHKIEKLEKTKKTCLERYNVENPAQVVAFQEKGYNTKKQKGTYGKSSAEDKVYILLLQKFQKDDVERQYYSNVYPFACDFYIKSLDLYIEFNGFWTHGREPYDPNNLKHQNIITFWKKKAEEVNFKGKKKDQYAAAIHTWTILDPKKVETAKRNNLNYKVFWKVKEVEVWLNSLDVKEVVNATF